MPTLYIETTIPSLLTAWPSQNVSVAAKQFATRSWWENNRHNYELRTSELVMVEAAEGDSVAAARRLDALRGVERLPVLAEADELAGRIAKAIQLPDSALADAAHIAICVVHDVDFLLTWNCRDIANAANRLKLERIASAAGLRCPIICTPEELPQ